MTIKKRLFLSNIMMILIPVIVTVFTGLLCSGLLWLALMNGGSLGMDEREEFDYVSRAIAEALETRLENGGEQEPEGGGEEAGLSVSDGRTANLKRTQPVRSRRKIQFVPPEDSVCPEILLTK